MEERNNTSSNGPRKGGFSGKPRNGSGKPFKKREGDGDNRGERKSYGNRNGNKRYGDRDNKGGFKKPYRKFDGERREGEDGERKFSGERRDGGRRYGDRDNRGEKRGFGRSDDRRKRFDSDERGERRGDRKPYGKRDGERRGPDSRKRFDKKNWTPRKELDELNNEAVEDQTFEAKPESPRDRKFSRRRDGQRADWVGGSDRGRKVDTITRRDLVQIATTDSSEDFVWAGAGMRHKDSEFFVVEGDPVIHEKYGEGTVVKIISGKVQIEFDDAKRWYAHPLAMEKGILRKPGVPVVADEPEQLTPAELESALDAEMAAVLFAAGASSEDFAIEVVEDVDMEEEPEDDIFGNADDAFSLDLDFETITVDDDAAADLFADVELLTGIDFTELEGDDE